MADVNFFKIFLFCKYLTWTLQIRTCWWGAGCCFLFTLVQGEHRNVLQLGYPWPRRGKNKSFLGDGGLAGVQDVKSSWWLAGWRAPHLHLSASDLLVNNAQKKRPFSPSPGMYEAGSEAERQEALTRLPVVGLYAQPWAIVCKVSVSPSTLGQISVVVEEKPGGLFL